MRYKRKKKGAGRIATTAGKTLLKKHVGEGGREGGETNLSERGPN